MDQAGPIQRRRYRRLVAKYDLLDAVNLRHVHTTADIAEQMSVDEAEVRRQLRAAEKEGLVTEEYDQSHNLPADADRQRWFLTVEGLKEWDRLDAEASD